MPFDASSRQTLTDIRDEASRITREVRMPYRIPSHLTDQTGQKPTEWTGKLNQK
jgi:hypothetical protein